MEAIQVFHFQAETQYIVGIPLYPLTIGGQEYGIVRKQVYCWVGTIGAFEVLFQKNPVLPFISLFQILKLPHPGYPAPKAWAVMAAITEGDQQPSIGGIDGLMTVTRQGGRHFPRSGPGPAFILTEGYERLVLPGILPHKQGNTFPVRGPDEFCFT